MEPSASNQPSAAGLGWAQTQGPRASSWSSSSAREQVLGGPASPNVGVTPKLCGECAPQSPERSMGLLPNGSSGRGRDSRAGQVAAEALLSFLDRSPAHTLDTVLSRSSAPPWTLLLLPPQQRQVLAEPNTSARRAGPGGPGAAGGAGARNGAGPGRPAAAAGGRPAAALRPRRE